MRAPAEPRSSLAQWLLAVAAGVSFALCVFYVFALLALVPAPGFLALNENWTVVEVDPGVVGRGLLRVGDQLLSIGRLTREDYVTNRYAVPFDGAHPGDLVPLTRLRDGQITEIVWEMPPVSAAALFSRLLISWPALVFFTIGLFIHLLLRPRNEQWSLLVGFCYITAIWLALGVVSSTNVAASSPGLHAATWFLSVVIFDLHLTFPRSLRPRRLPLRALLYGGAALMAALELLALTPRWLYQVPLLLAVLSAFSHLLYHWRAKAWPDSRVAARLMLVGVGLALGPGILLAVAPSLLGQTSESNLAGYLALFPVPLLPLFYAYAIYKRSLGRLEFRANHWLSLYAFLVVDLTALVLALLAGQALLADPDRIVLYSIVVSAVFVATAPFAYSAFQRLADRVAYGALVMPENLVHALANQITTVSSRPTLTTLLAERIVPNLYIRQSALFLFTGGAPDQVYAAGLSPAEASLTSGQLAALLLTVGRYLPEDAASPAGLTPAPRWVRLAVPLQVEHNRLGLWLFGRRDPDDYYPRRDIELLTTLANQVALAAENLRLFQGMQLRLAELQAIFDVSESLATAGSLAEILQVLVDRALICAPPASGAIIHRLEAATGLLVVRAVAGAVTENAGPPRLLADSSLAGRAMRERRRIYSPDVERDPDYTAGRSGGGSLVCIPLVVEDEVLGNLSVISPRRQAFGDDDLRVLESLGHQAAVALKKAQVTDSLVESLAVVQQRSLELEASVARLKSTQLQLVQAGKLAALGTLSAGLAHEINNPLAAIKMYAQNIKRSQQRGGLTEAMLVKNLSSIDTLVDKIAHVITHFRDFSRRSSNTYAQVNLNQPVASALDMFGDQLALRDITVTTDFAPDLPPVWADANQLEQVMVNLISNARDALTGQPQRRLQLRTAQVDGQVMVEVADTGCGISPAALEHIFEPFFTTKEPGQGTGLGLAISHGIIEDHQGRLEVDSAPGQGTTFRLVLPKWGERFV
ncbi:MAG: GAF domain-containing protein [Anaerolineales bacterium]|nr:GAF domain-containing protein [Anaerolineales bacterium]